MQGSRLVLTVVAVVIGVASAVLGNWWTVTAMVLVVVSRVLAERRDRRGAAAVLAQPER